MKTPITFSQAVTGFELAAEARHLSPHTIRDYQNTFRKFTTFLASDPPLAQINHHQVEQFLAAQTVSNKTVLNYHTGLSSLWTWAAKEGLVKQHILHLVERPDPEKPAIVPLTESDVHALLSAVSQSRAYSRPHKRTCSHTLQQADRSRAILLLMLDTGVRASELCNLHINQVDLRNRRIKVFGKMKKERSLPFSPRTGQTIWRYLVTRKDARVDELLFVTANNRPFDRDQLLKFCTRLGARAGINDVHPHRFRHTFAIEYLRNGGDPYALQEMLGHTTMEMVKVYLHLAQVDLDNAHRRASPVDNWRL